MNIENEREAFEAWLFKYYPKAKELGLVYRPNENLYEHRQTQIRWIVWQAAKAHEAEKLKGCVVVPVELSEEAIYKINDSLAFQDEESVRYAWHEMVEAANRGND